MQTRLGKYVTNRLNHTYGTNIHVKGIGLQFNGDVELKNILIKDYKNDTLISATELNTSLISFNNILKNKLAFGDIDVEDLIFNIKTYQGEEDTNLDVFVARFEEDNPSKDPSNFLLSSSDITIYNGIFRFINENNETPKILEFTNININATNFVIHGPKVTTRINTLAFADSRGLQMDNLSANFAYSKEAMSFNDLKIKTKNSQLQGQIQFLYNREDFADFTNKVNIQAKINNADIALNEINTFYQEFGINQHAKLSANITGTLNNLQVNNLRLNTSTNTRLNGNLNFKNLFEAADNNFVMQGQLNNLTSNYNDLKRLLPNVLGASIPSVFQKLGNFSISGNTKITSENILANLEMQTDLGKVHSDLQILRVNDIDRATYIGDLILDDFNLGTFLSDPKLEKISANLEISGKGFTKNQLQTRLDGTIFNIFYNQYDYKNIQVSGNLANKIFNGDILSNDANAKLNFKGLVDFSKKERDFNFEAQVDYANLKALHFIKNDSLSIFKGNIITNLKGTSLDDVVGAVQFKKTSYQNQNDSYYFDDFAITSSFANNKRYIKVNSPDIIKGELSGVFNINDLDELVLNAVGSLYTNYKPYEIETNQYVDFNFKIYNKIIEIFVPKLKIGKNTFVKGSLESTDKAFKLTFKSPKMEWLDYFANSIELQIDNTNPLFNSYVEIDSINTNVYNISKFNLINVTLNDTLFMQSEFKAGTKAKDIYNLSFYHTLNPQKKSVVGFKKSDVTFKGNKWFINPDRDNKHQVVFDKELKHFQIQQFLLQHQNEIIKLSGTLQGDSNKNLDLEFDNVQLANITPNIENLSLKGLVNGKLNFLEQNKVYLPSSALTIENLNVNNLNLGNFNANIKGNNSLTNYTVDASIKDDNQQTFLANGNINLSEKPSIDVNLKFKQFNLQPLNPFLEDVLRDINGFITGNIAIQGNLNKPKINGEVKLNQGSLGIPELNVDYRLADQSLITLKNQSFLFNNLNLTDTVYNTTAKLSGSISHVNLSDWSLNLSASTNRLLVLNTTESEDQLYYGTGFVGGTATIAGPANQLIINFTGETQKGTVFKIPLSDSESFGDNSFIHFLSPEEKQAKLEGNNIDTKEISGLELDFDVEVTQDAEIEIVMDKENGSTIRGRGEGVLLAEINTNGKFNMYGDFSVFKGVYNFKYGGIIQKEFNVVPGGTLAWDGDPLKARINIEAIYKTQANPSPLLDTPINRRIPVDLGIHLTGELEKPEPDYNFNFPNLSSTLKSELNYRLESRDDRSNQALFLLATGSFSSGLSELNINGTIEERLNGIVNSLLSSGDNKFQVGLNVQLGENRPEYQTEDRLGVTLQTNITDRIQINGKVGVPIGGVSQTAIAGDVQIDFLLNEEGTLTAKVFNRENSIRNFGEEIGYTQGMGLSYTVDFDSFKELLQIIFVGKKKLAKKQSNTKNNENNSSKSLPKYIGFKKQTDTIVN